MKNIEWLKKEIEEVLYSAHLRGEHTAMQSNAMYDDIVNKIDQLDEPETLSKKWIDEHRESTFDLDLDEDFETVFIKVEELQDLLVPKQELPVIPNYVAKWISVHHERFDLYPALKRLESNALSWEDVYEWYRRNTHTFVNAYLTGKYEVEGKQKYYVLDSEDIPLLEIANNQTCKTTTGLSIYEDGRDNSRFELTEQEIKDYDERYWSFAKPVKELEE